jgi:hypothetical protein
MLPLRRFLPVLLPAALLLASCRENGPVTGSTSPLRFQPAFRTGDRFGYGVYEISPTGTVFQSSRQRSTWTVAATAAERNGRSGVTVFVDSAAGGGTDTVMLCVEPGGDVYLFGFLEAVESLRSMNPPAPRWDRVAAFSLGPLAQWRVGSLSASEEKPLYGEVGDGYEYVSVPVNGENIVFPAYRVDFTGEGVDGSMWFAEEPPCLAIQFVTFWMDTTGRGRWLEHVIRGPG